MLDVLVLEVPDALRQPGGRPVPVRVPPHIPRVAVVAGLEGPAGLPAVRSHNCDRQKTDKKLLFQLQIF